MLSFMGNRKSLHKLSETKKNIIVNSLEREENLIDWKKLVSLETPSLTLEQTKKKGEVRAICRFWVFGGNWLLGHQLIDSRWFERNPPTESGWKRRSKNRRSTGISRGNDRDVMSAFIFAPIFTPLIFIHFCVWLRTLCWSLVVEGSVIRSRFFAKPFYSFHRYSRWLYIQQQSSSSSSNRFIEHDVSGSKRRVQ